MQHGCNKCIDAEMRDARTFTIDQHAGTVHRVLVKNR